MNAALQKLLVELEDFGQANDQGTEDRAQRMLNITRDTGEFLSVLVRGTNAHRVLEIGTSNGYSTLWLADACNAIGGSVTTVELSEQKYTMAKKNFERSNSSSAIRQVLADAGDCLSEAEDNAYDLIFSTREERIIRTGGRT